MESVSQEKNLPIQNNPLISIVTVCLNSETTIEKTLESLLSQDFRDFECIVVDGVSKDQTLTILHRYSILFEQAGIRFSFTSEPDLGIYDAINKGITCSKGTLVGILNSDDFYEPDALQNVSRVFYNSSDAGIFYGFLRQLKGDNELVIRRYNYDYILSSLDSGIYSAAQHPACFVKKSVYQEIGVYDTSFPIAADYDFLLRAKKLGVGFVAMDSIITNFRSGGASSKMTLEERLEQRYRAQYKNGLLLEPEYQQKRNEINYRRFSALKSRFVKRIFQF